MTTPQVSDSAYNVMGLRSSAGAGFRDFLIREDGVVYATAAGSAWQSLPGQPTINGTLAIGFPAAIGFTPIGVAAAS